MSKDLLLPTSISQNNNVFAFQINVICPITAMDNLAQKFRLAWYVKWFEVCLVTRGTNENLALLDTDLSGLRILEYDSPAFAIHGPGTVYPGNVALKMGIDVESIGRFVHVRIHLIPRRKDAREVPLLGKRQLVDSCRNIHTLWYHQLSSVQHWYIGRLLRMIAVTKKTYTSWI